METQPRDVNDVEFQFEKYWEIVKKRRYILIAFVLFTLAVMLVPVYRQAAIYEARGTLLIDRETTSNTLIFGDFMAMQYGLMDDYFNSQVRILRSRSLARDALEELNLLSFRSDRQASPSPANPVLKIFKKEDAPPDEGAQISAKIDGFLGSMSVSPVKESRLVEVRFRSDSPQMAAKSVNTLFTKFIEFNLKIKTESMRLASEFITNQIEELRQTLSQKEHELQQYGERKELFYLSSQESTVVDKFSDVNKAFTQAQIDRINKEAAFRELRGKDYGSLPEVRSNMLIDNLKKEYSSLESEYKRKSQIFKESYPEMQRLRSQMDGLQKRIDAEVRDVAQKAINGAENEYQSALKRESYLNTLLAEQKKSVVSTNTNAIYYNSLKIEVDNMRSLLDYLVKKQKESLLTSRLEGLQTSNIKVIDFAEVPRYPLTNNKRRALLMALFLGLGGGLALIFGLDFLDRSISTPEDIGKYLQLPALGMVPAVGGHVYPSHYTYYSDKRDLKKEKDIHDIELVNFLHPDSSYAEHYRNIRTSLMLSTPGDSPRMIVVTSSAPSEGKTVTAVNLAVAFAQLSKRVLLVDMDLRKPRIHKVFRLKNTEGVTSCLVGRCKAESAITKTPVPNLSILPSGPLPPNPVELINSEVCKAFLRDLTQRFDIVFLDCPPLVGIVDPIILGKEADGAILVIWGGKTNRKIIEKVRNEFDKFGVRLFGVVLNRLSRRHHSGYYYSSSYKYGSRYGAEQGPQRRV